jgi:hypothetical protein
MKRIIAWLGVAMFLPFFLWLALGFTDLVPSMIDIFGVVGLRTPAAFTIAGLLIAAIGFYEELE